jgi:hypothetical protein
MFYFLSLLIFGGEEYLFCVLGFITLVGLISLRIGIFFPLLFFEDSEDGACLRF